MFKRRNADPVRSAESEIARLRQRRDELAVRLRAAEGASEVAVRTQREAMISADLDSPAAKKVEAECQTALFRRDSLSDAYEEAERLLAEIEEQVATAKNKAERTRVADDLVQRATEIDMLVAEFPAAITTVTKLHAAFVELVQAKGVSFEIFPGLTRSAQNIGFNVLHAALSALPVSVERRHPDAPPARVVREVIREQQTDPMRALAEAIRTGGAALTADQPITVPEVRPTVAIPERNVVLKTPVLYLDVDRRPTQVIGGPVRLPEPVAMAALEQDVGYEPGTPAADDVLRTMSRDGTAYGYRGGYLDLGVDPSEHVAQERQSLAERAAA